METPNESYQDSKFHLDDIITEVDDAILKEELRSCQHLPVVSKNERAGHQVFNHAIENLIGKTVDKKLDHFSIV